MSTTSRLLVLARLVSSAVLCRQGLLEQATIDITKPYKPRRLKLDPISVMRRRLYKLTTRDPSITRKRALYKKAYNRKNKHAIERRRDYVQQFKKRMPPRPGTVSPKRSSGEN